MRFFAAATLAVVVALAAGPALAQIAHHPFAIGVNEGGIGHQSGLGAWLIAQESRFYLGLNGAVRAVKQGGGAWLLVGLSFAYGIFHAAGPGHGKTVLTSYMLANEVALRRGFAISLAAALLQGSVATAIIGIAAFVFHATSARMTAAAQACEVAGYLAIVGLGLVLVWRKGRALVAALRPVPAAPPLMLAAAGPGLAFGGGSSRASSRFFADDGQGHAPDCECGAPHIPDPTALGGRTVDWRAVAAAIVAIGARPCSGAIVVLVFSLAQGLFLAGVAATYAMALGTALTTGALAATAVLAKGLAVRLSGAGSRATLGRVLEFGAAACVLLFGIALLAAAFSGVHVTG